MGVKRRFGLSAWLLAILMFALLPLGQAWGQVIIDDFSTNQNVTRNTVGVSTGSALGGGIIGGTRDVSLNCTGNTTGLNFSMVAIIGLFSYNQDTGITGNGFVQWDNNTPFDLTDSGQSDAVYLRNVDPQGTVTIRLTVTSGGTDMVADRTFSPGLTPWTIIPFSTFSNYSLARFGNVDSIRMTIPDAGTTTREDLELDEIGTMSLLRCTKAFDTHTAIAGETITVTLTVYNDDPLTARNFNITDTIDAGLTYINGTASPVPTGSTAQSINWNNLPILSNSIQVFTYQILAGDTAGNFCNDVDVVRADDVTITTTCQDCVDVSLPPGPTCTKLFDKDTALVGETINVTLTVTNNDTTSARDFDIADAIDVGMTFIGVTGPTPAPTTSGLQFVTWDAVSIGIGLSQVFTYQILVGDGAGTFCNDVDVVMVGFPSLTTTCQDCVIVSLPPGPTCTKLFDKDTALVGETINVTLTVTNNDTTSARDFDIADAIDVGMTFIGVTGPTPAPTTSGLQFVTWDAVSIGIGLSQVFTYQILVGDGAGTFCNDVDVVMVGFPSLTTTCQDCVIVSLPPGPRCTKVFDKETVDYGETITVTLTIYNDDTSSARDFDVTDTMPAGGGLTYVLGSADVPVTTETATLVTWDNLTIATGGNVVITYQILVGDQDGSFCNDVDVVMVGFPSLTTTCQDCVIVEPPPPPPEVPTFTQWGIMGLSLLLAVSGLWLIRRRRSMS